MNTVLHVFVYVFLALAGTSLFFEIKLNEKRTELTDRNRMQENYLVSIASTIENADPAKDTVFEVKKDVSPVEAKIVDDPETEDLLADYQAPLEQANLATYTWKQRERDLLRTVYILDPMTGKPVMDGNIPQTRESPEDKLLTTLFNSAKAQQARLNTTRAALTEMRNRLEAVVDELNKLKPVARQDKVTIVERDAKIAKLEEEKADLENQIVRLKAQIEELNTEVASLKDEVVAAHGETEEAREEIAKQKKLIDQLQQMLKEAIQSKGGERARGAAVAALPAGDKGKIVEVDNEDMFAIVEFTAEALNELKGGDVTNPLPALELGIRRPGFQGEAGEFVGRIRIRQEVKGKNYVVCDILGSWEHDKAQKDDIIFAD